MLKLLSLFTFLFLSTSPELISQLSKICSSYEYYKVIYDQSMAERKNQLKHSGSAQSAMKKTFKTYLLYGVIERWIFNFTRNITSSPRMIGSGSYGAVFMFSNISNSNPLHHENVAVKLLKISQDTASRAVQKEQYKVFKEIYTMNKLSRQRNGKYYFPSMLDCFVITDLLGYHISDLTQRLLDGNKSLATLAQNLAHKEVIILPMEKLDMTLTTFIDYAKTVNGIRFTDRLKMSLNLMSGLAMMSAHFIHCDIKPDNVMIKNITNERISHKAPVIKTKAGESFLVKYIDFGISVSKDSECKGGTPGFAAPELSESIFDHSNFDLFSLGVLLIDMELGFAKFPQKLSNLFVLTTQMKSLKIKKINIRMQKQLLKQPIVVALKEIYDSLDPKEITTQVQYVNDELRKRGLAHTVKSIFKLQSDHLPGLFEHSVQYFEFMVCFLMTKLMYKILMEKYNADLLQKYQLYEREIELENQFCKSESSKMHSKNHPMHFKNIIDTYMHYKKSPPKANGGLQFSGLLRTNLFSFKSVTQMMLSQKRIQYYQNLQKIGMRMFAIRQEYYFIILEMISWVPVMRSSIKFKQEQIKALLIRFTKEMVPLYKQNMVIMHLPMIKPKYVEYENFQVLKINDIEHNPDRSEDIEYEELDPLVNQSDVDESDEIITPKSKYLI